MPQQTQRKTLLPYDFTRLAALCLLLLGLANPGPGSAQPAQDTDPEPVVTQLLVNGRPVKFYLHGINQLPATPATITFACGAEKADPDREVPLRFRYRLEGHDSDWRELTSQMRVIMVFLDQEGSEVSRKEFVASGHSRGWTGDFQTSLPQHRKETFKVPPQAEGFRLIIVSAGAPDTLGAFAVSGLTVRATAATNPLAKALLQLNEDASPPITNVWRRDGTRTKMARIIKIGGASGRTALSIVDDDARGHAQWNSLKTKSPAIHPGETLVMEWEEMFSVGLAAPANIEYQDLPPGLYRFFLERLTVMGAPTGKMFVLEIDVPPPFWRAPWFWGCIFTLILAGMFLSYRYRAWNRLRAENHRLAQQQVLERERIRIAQDIHDDLGAQVTQITLVSALAERSAADPQASRENFQQITQLSRRLVTSLYDTIWVVNPENDNLEAVGDYLCQMFNQLLSRAGVSCRLEVPPLPAQVLISSHQRHNLSMAIKEATHNIIKHAAATEARMSIKLDPCELNIVIQDNGHGFNLEAVKHGNGLENLKRRLKNIGGSAEVICAAGVGTVVHLRMPFNGPLK